MLKAMRSAVMAAVCAGLFLLHPSKSWAQVTQPMELGAGYNFVNSNAPPGGCGCFSLNGGSGWFAYHFSRSLALVGEIGSGYASNIDHTNADLNLTSFLGGPRYTWHRGHRLAPFGQILLGGAHASGPLTPGSSGLAGSANAFAMAAGGGLDVKFARHWTVRLAQVDYYLTTFTNGSNDHQNNLRVGVGIAYHLGPAR